MPVSANLIIIIAQKWLLDVSAQYSAISANLSSPLSITIWDIVSFTNCVRAVFQMGQGCALPSVDQLAENSNTTKVMSQRL
jgi:hypothetical protein